METPKQEEQILPLLPLRGVLVFPYMVIHLDVGREKSIMALEEAMISNRKIFLATQRDAQKDEPNHEDLYSIGCIAEVKQLLKLPGGTVRVLVEGIRRGEILEHLEDEPFFRVKTMAYDDSQEKTAE